jgi:hypothetical protein
MAIDVTKYIENNNAGKDGSVIIAPGALKIVPAFASRQRILPKINVVVTDTTSYNKLDNRF